MTATRSRRSSKQGQIAVEAVIEAQQADAIRVGEVVQELDRTLLSPGQFQNRDIFEPVRLAELAESIRANGIKLPLIVRPTGDGRYGIVAGERRWRASAIAGLATVPCIVRDLSDEDHALTTALENLQRVDLTPIEEARDFRTLRDVAGYDLETTAQRIGRPAEYIRDSLRLLELPERAQALIHHGAWSAPEGDPERKVLRLSRAQGLALAQIQKDDNPGLTDLLAELAMVNGVSAQRILNPQQRRDMLYSDAARIGQLPTGQPDPDKAKIVRLPQAKWLDTNCFRCPYACFEGTTDHYGAKYCLKPEHYFVVVERERVREEEATERRRKDAETALAQALAAKEAKLTNADLPAADETAPDGTPPAPPAVTIPDLRTLAPGSYVELVGRELKEKAPACTDDCPCRAMARNHAGALVPICADPGRFRKLKAAETRSANKDRRKEAKALMTRLAGDIDTAAATPLGFTERELRIIALAALDGITSGTKNLTSAGRHVLPYLGQATLFGADGSGYSPNLLRKIGAEKLAAVPTGALVRFAAESLALHDLYAYHDYGWEGKVMQAYRRDGDEEGMEAPEASPEDTPAQVAREADDTAVYARWQEAQAAIRASGRLVADCVILVERAAGDYVALGVADGHEVAALMLDREDVELADLAGYACWPVPGAALPDVLTTLATLDRTVVVAAVNGHFILREAGGIDTLPPARIGEPPVAERRASDTIPTPEAAPEGAEASLDPVASGEPDPDVALAHSRNDWAYEVLAQNDRDVSAFIVLHRTEGGDLIGINQDADYLAQTFAFDLEAIPGQPDSISSRVAARDAGRIMGQIANEHGYFVAVIPHEGAAIEEFAGDEPGDGDGEGDEESYYAGPDLEDRLAALEAITTS